EWESLCDGCGKCCLLKLEDEDTGKREYTRISCHLLDLGQCKCSDYPHRHQRVPDCLKFDEETVRTIDWLPKTCAYRLINEEKDLPSWHPLVSGYSESVHEAGMSIRSWAINEKQVSEEKYFDYIIDEI
ncbi:MAG: YcgN family cysteine cluster protein, partial [Desulfobulbia bacterium]